MRLFVFFLLQFSFIFLHFSPEFSESKLDDSITSGRFALKLGNNSFVVQVRAAEFSWTGNMTEYELLVNQTCYYLFRGSIELHPLMMLYFARLFMK